MHFVKMDLELLKLDSSKYAYIPGMHTFVYL